MADRALRLPLILSIVAAVVTMGLKAAACAATNSTGLLADALESGVNLVAAVVAYFSLAYASRPADADHTFGHEKIEFFSSGLEGTLVAVAGIAGIAFAARRLVYPQPLEELGLGVGMAIAAAAVNLVVGVVLLRAGRRHGSIILEADGVHLITDVVTTMGVAAGLGLVAWTGRDWLDPLIAALVGLVILRTGLRLIRRSYDGLMDRALAPAEIVELRALITQTLPPGAAFHHLRTRRAGRRRFADFHLLIAGGTTVTDGHRLVHEIEERMQAVAPHLEVAVHLEPIDEPSSWEPEELARLGEDPRG